MLSMSLTFQSGESIKLALIEELQNILSPNSEVRVNAEGRMKQLEITEGYGVFLSEIIMNQSFDLSLRQLASVMLTRYVELHWMTSNDDVNVIVSDLAKRMIRSILPNGLYDPNSKIRTSVAYTISTIATIDWPNTWTELFDIIVKCLGGNEDSIHGAMQVLIEFTYDLDSQIDVVGPIIMSQVYRIFEAEQVYNVKTRTCAVEIFKSLFKSINEHVESKEKQEEMLKPILPGLIEKLIYSLSNPNGELSSFTLKTEIIKVFEYLVNEMPKFIHQYTSQILPPIWQLLTQTADIYVKVIVNQSEPSPFPENGEADFNTMVLQIMEFIHSLVEGGNFKSAIKTVMTDLIYIMIVYMQITEEKIELWSDDSEQFIIDDFLENDIDSTVRSSSHDVLENISTEFGAKVLPAFFEALTRHIDVAEAEKSSGSPNWWKILEATIVAVGAYRHLIDEREERFDFPRYLIYVQNLMSCGTSPYLMSRCLWILSRFAGANNFTEDSLVNVLNAIQNGLEVDKPLNLRIYAVRSIYELCESLKESNDKKRALTVSKLPIFLDGVMTIVPMGKSSVLSMVLETLTLMISFDANLAAVAQSKIISLTIAVFLKYHEDPYLLAHVQDMLRILCQNPFCLQPLQEKIVPTLVSILNSESNLGVSSALRNIALDVLQTIVKYSTAPLSDQLIQTAFPAAVECILHTDDHSIMQSGGECIRAFVYVSPEQVCSYRNGEGLKYVLQVITMLLNPMNTEYSAVFVGRLVITTISKASNMLGESVFLILKAVISKMQLVESLSVAMSLILTFAHLFISQMDALLNFLSTVPGPTGEPAIQYVFSQWLCRQHLFYGAYERKVSTMALCKLLEHGVTTKDVRLTSVTIRDKIDANEGKVRTRSHTCNATEQWANVPILVKIFKLLINELAFLKEMNSTETDSDTENEDNDDLSSSNLSKTSTLKVVSDLMYNEESNEETDQLMEELMQDPAFQINIEENLTKFLQNFSRDDNFSQFTQHLTQLEKIILQGIQVSVS